ncbi:unnamed protein product [Brassica oleracea var. botrytis]|uniref:Extensin domain-containing protein n=2 Tax=Brassica TaxID=3705 RepID=A0A3P6CG23_BRAOL|nr:unnamed protein product [Brassica napus]VDD08771.1 unnamed protein product [Brassica oleracea]
MRNTTFSSKLVHVFTVFLLCHTQSVLPSHHEPLSITGLRRELTRVRRSKSPPALHYSPPPRPQSPPPPKMLHIPPPPLSVPHKTSLKHPVSHMPQTGQKNKPKVYG